MARFLVILGILGIIGGTAGMAYSIIAPIQETVSSVTNIDEQARALCVTGEQLVVEQGASTRNTSGTYGRPTYYYCVNSDGVRREVTGQVVGDVMDNTFGTIGSTIANSFIWGGVIFLGVIFIIIGAIMGVGKRVRAGGYTATINGQPFVMTRGGLNIPDMMDMSSASMPQDTAARLQKLEHLYQTGVISREEYDRARQKILEDIR